MRGRFLLGVLLLSVTLPTQGRASDLEVATKLSWASAAQPILHVLVKNNGDQARTVNVVAPQVLNCGGKRVFADSKHRRAFIDLTTWHASSTDGVVQPGGWLHRSYPLALDAELEPPCEVTFGVWDKETLKEVHSGTISVPAEPPRPSVSDFEAPSVLAEVMVEEDRSYPDLLIARVLVQNLADQALVLYEDERSFECATNGARVSWPMLGGVLQGEDSGPVWLGPGEWTVFVNVVRLVNAPHGSCSVSFRIAGLHESGLRREVARVSAVLDPQGYLERPWRHRR